MRLESVTLHNVGPFRDFVLDLATLGDARLIAVVGANGAGKSTLLECAIPGALYRETPTRGSLTSLATARDSYVEARVVNGKAWTIRHSLDCVSGKSEALVLDAGGAPVLPDTKVSGFDRWAARTFPPPEVLFSSVFAAQAGAGFLGAKPAERKATLLRVLGVERLERLADASRERARDARGAAATLAARVEDERRRGGDVAALEAELSVAREAAAGADATAAEARQRLADAQAAAATAQAARDAYDVACRAYQDSSRRRDDLAAQVRDLEAKAADLRTEADYEPDRALALSGANLALSLAQESERNAAAAAERARVAVVEAQHLADARATLEAQCGGLAGRLGAVRGRLADAEQRIANNEAVLADADAIRAAVADRDRLVAEALQFRQDAAESDAAARLAAQQGEEALRAVATHQARALTERARAERLRDAIGQAAAIESAARCLPGLRRDLDAAEAEARSAERVLEDLRGRKLAGADERIAGLRGGLELVIGADRHPEAHAFSPEEIAARTLATDDAAVSAAAEVPEAITHAAARVTRARERADRARTALQESDALAALSGRLESDRAALSEVERAEREETDQAAAAEQTRATAVQQAAANRGARDGYLGRAAILMADAGALAPMVAKAEPLAGAEQRLADLLPIAAAAREEIDGLLAEATALDQRIDATPPSDVDAARRLVTDAEQEQERAGRLREDATAAVTSADARLAGARLAAARLAELEPQAERARADMATLERELDAGHPPAPPLPVALDAVEHLATRTADEARSAAQAVAVAEQQLEQARVAAGRLAELGAELSTAEADLADWTRLALDLGRDGLQGAEIDAAGPELTELVNDLLHRCLGPRFTVSIETQRLSADGKRTLEGCEVRVLDVERGRDTTAETLSGGEAVLVGEAVSLALAMLACRRAGVERPTLVRDESGAALSPENARVYVAMLRRAAELVDADKVLLVSHTPEVWDLCDARIEIGGSRA